jgi:hypothetical protein
MGKGCLNLRFLGGNNSFIHTSIMPKFGNREMLEIPLNIYG